MRLKKVQVRIWLGGLVGVLILLYMVGGLRVLSASAAPSEVAVSAGDWPMDLHDLGRSSYNGAETTINVTTAPNLKVHWMKTANGFVAAQPVVTGGKIYWGAWDGLERASSLTGSKVWATNLGVSPPANCDTNTVGVTSTATKASVVINGVTTSVVFVGGGDANFYALDAKTGAIIWKTPLGTLPGNFIWSSPAIYNGNVYIGVSSRGDCPLVQGQLVKMNAATGQILHTFNTVPNGCQGASVWGSATIDTAAGNIYFVTGNGGSCSSAEPYAIAIVELRISDLSFVAAWQVPSTEAIPDGDFGSTPTLFTATINGTMTKMVGVPNKNGIYYAFKRDAISSGPVWKTRIANGGECPECGDGDISPSAWDGSKLYVASSSTTIGGQSCLGSLRALNPATGAFLWEDCMNDGTAIGAVSAIPGVAFVGEGSHMVAVKTANGAQLFNYDTGALIYGGPSISNGVVYIGSTSNNLYAFGL